MVASSRPSPDSTPSPATAKPKTPSTKYPPICLRSSSSAGRATRSRRLSTGDVAPRTSIGQLFSQRSAQTPGEFRSEPEAPLSSATVSVTGAVGGPSQLDDKLSGGVLVGRVALSRPSTPSAPGAVSDRSGTPGARRNVASSSSTPQSPGHLQSGRPSSSAADPGPSVPLYQYSTTEFQSSVQLQASDLQHTPGACRNATAYAAGGAPKPSDPAAAGATAPVLPPTVVRAPQGTKPSFSSIVRAPQNSFIRSHSISVEAFGSLPDIVSAPRFSKFGGEPFVNFSPEELLAAEKIFEDAIVIKFLSGRPKWEACYSSISAWGLQNNFIMGPLDSRSILLRFRNHKDMLLVLARESNYINGFPYRAFRWNRMYNVKEDAAIVPVWVSFPHLPIPFFVPSMLKGIANSIGKFLSFDRATSLMTRASSARVCIEVDLRTRLPDNVWIGVHGKFRQPIIYEKLPKYCTFCKTQGHSIEVCQQATVHHGDTDPASLPNQVDRSHESDMNPFSVNQPHQTSQTSFDHHAKALAHDIQPVPIPHKVHPALNANPGPPLKPVVDTVHPKYKSTAGTASPAFLASKLPYGTDTLASSSLDAVLGHHSTSPPTKHPHSTPTDLMQITDIPSSLGVCTNTATDSQGTSAHSGLAEAALIPMQVHQQGMTVNGSSLTTSVQPPAVQPQVSQSALDDNLMFSSLSGQLSEVSHACTTDVLHQRPPPTLSELQQAAVQPCTPGVRQNVNTSSKSTQSLQEPPNCVTDISSVSTSPVSRKLRCSGADETSLLVGHQIVGNQQRTSGVRRNSVANRAAEPCSTDKSHQRPPPPSSVLILAEEQQCTPGVRQNADTNLKSRPAPSDCDAAINTIPPQPSSHVGNQPPPAPKPSHMPIPSDRASPPGARRNDAAKSDAIVAQYPSSSAPLSQAFDCLVEQGHPPPAQRLELSVALERLKKKVHFQENAEYSVNPFQVLQENSSDDEDCSFSNASFDSDEGRIALGYLSADDRSMGKPKATFVPSSFKVNKRHPNIPLNVRLRARKSSHPSTP